MFISRNAPNLPRLRRGGHLMSRVSAAAAAIIVPSSGGEPAGARLCGLWAKPLLGIASDSGCDVDDFETHVETAVPEIEDVPPDAWAPTHRHRTKKRHRREERRMGEGV